MRFSEDAVNKTFFCVNLAPQDSFTNQNPWREVEVRSETKLGSTAGAFVQTGLCSEDNLVDGPETYRGWRIPKCFWKLMCYKDSSTGLVQVVGFIGPNTLVGKADTVAQAQRRTETMTPRSQAEVLSLLSRPEIVGEAWTTAGTSLILGRGVVKSKIPTSAQCKAALGLSPEIAAEWSQFVNA
jgi:DNA/RNA endonuclease G (NUC1)